MKICISIPVHEKPDVIVDQINNINYFYGHDVFIVLHISKNFNYPNQITQDRDYEFRSKENVFVNPEQLSTSCPSSLVHVHNSNFKYAKQKLDFDFFVLHASNDMYVRKGAKEFIRESKNGCFQFEFNSSSSWTWAPLMFEDIELKKIVNYLGISKMCVSQPEGMYFQTDVFEEMVKVIDKFYSYGRGSIYPREEVYYPTFISKFTNELNKPIVYSEVLSGQPIDSDLIIKLNANQKKNNPSDVYDFENLYAVKRVKREYYDPNRILIRNFITLKG